MSQCFLRATRTLGLAGFSVSCAVYDASLLEGGDAGSADQGLGGSDGSASGGAATGGAPAAATGGISSGGECSWGAIAAPEATLSLLDDFDDGDKWILPTAGRSGRWNSDNDQSGGSQSPSGLGWESLPMSERSDVADNLALHYVGQGFSSWHLLLAELAAGEPYDLSAYVGIDLWVRADCQPTVAESVQLRIAISDAESFASAGAIDHAGYAVPFILTPSWRHLHVPFSSFSRRFGSSTALDVTTAHAFVLSPNAPGALEVWVDELAFY